MECIANRFEIVGILSKDWNDPYSGGFTKIVWKSKKILLQKR